MRLIELSYRHSRHAEICPFFVEPDYGSQETGSMANSIPQADIDRVQPPDSKLLTDVRCIFGENLNGG